MTVLFKRKTCLEGFVPAQLWIRKLNQASGKWRKKKNSIQLPNFPEVDIPANSAQKSGPWRESEVKRKGKEMPCIGDRVEC